MGWTFYSSTGQRLQTSATVLATQAEMETGTALTSFVTPGRTQYHPGVAKAWLDFTMVSTQTINSSYNITSITDDGVGLTTVTFATDFSDANYAWSTDGDQHRSSIVNASAAAGSLQVRARDSDDAQVDTGEYAVIVFGDQA